MTKRFCSDQVLYRLYGGPPDTAAPVQKYDVWAALGQKVNGLFKLHQLDTTLPSGETIPDFAMIATYEDNTVVSSGEKSYALLPVQPISLPKNMGICLVYDPNFDDMPFIPLQKGMTALLRTDTLLSDIMGQISYTPGKDRITFNKDLTTLGIDVVTMELCVFQISQYSETKELPIPADYEERIINELVAQFSPVQPESGVVNAISTQGQQQTKQ
jgi:hypothetical protein